MSSKYATQFKIPEGLLKLTKDFAREVLRAQPKNILEFGLEYFQELLKAQNTSPNVAIVENLKRVFEEHDPALAGILPYMDVKSIFSDPANQLNERSGVIALLECEINDDGQIDYNKFLNVAVEVLDSADANGPLDATDGTVRVHIHGMVREEFVGTLSHKLEEHDVKGESGLERNLLRNAFSDPELGLTRYEVNGCMGFLEEHHADGQFEYSVLADSLWEVLVTAHEENFLTHPATHEAVTHMLMNLFAQNDPEKKGDLPSATVLAVLKKSNLGFTDLQCHAILGLLADLKVDVNYSAFTDYIAKWVVIILRGRELREPATTIAGMTRDQLSKTLSDELMKYDPYSNGVLKYDDLVTVVSNISFTPREKSAILSYGLVEDEEKGGSPYEALAQNAFDVCWQQQRLGLDTLG